MAHLREKVLRGLEAGTSAANEERSRLGLDLGLFQIDNLLVTRRQQGLRMPRVG